MWSEINGKPVWKDTNSGKHGLAHKERFGIRRHYTKEEMGSAPQGAWWGKVIPAVLFLGILAYVLFKLATMQP